MKKNLKRIQFKKEILNLLYLINFQEIIINENHSNGINYIKGLIFLKKVEIFL